MQNPEATATIRETIKRMRESLNEIAEKCQLNAPHDEGLCKQKCTDSYSCVLSRIKFFSLLVHPFGQINVEEAKTEFLQSTNYIRNVYESWCTSGRIQESSKYRKYLQSREQVSSYVEKTRKDLQQCCQMGEQHLLKSGKSSAFKGNSDAFVKQITVWLQDVAKKVHLDFGIDINGESSDTDTKTISMWDNGSFIVDVSLIKTRKNFRD